MMFHVERIVKWARDKVIMLLTILVLFVGCGIAKPKHTIPDFVTVPNAIDILGNKGLTAFLFENNKQNLPFQVFMTTKFNKNNYLEREFWVTIDGIKFMLIVYDNDELEKYINISDFVLINQNPDITNRGNQSDFIAISVIDSNNNDCLADDSLYQQIVLDYLKNLKDQYIAHE